MADATKVGNNLKDLIAFFSTPERPVSSSEMMALWKDLPETSPYPNVTTRSELRDADLSALL